MIVIGSEEVARELDRPGCITLMREAMIALSAGRTRQLLRGIIDLGGGDLFGVMPGAMEGAGFGAKLVSVFRSASAQGRSHQGAILLFDRETGAPVCVVDAGEVTAIRTACASAAATDALARPDATHLAILGTGEQAWQHALAMSHVRPLESVVFWGRSEAKAHELRARIKVALALPTNVAESAAAAAHGADIICTTTSASEPILLSADVADGTHINVVGSSYAGPSEIDGALVQRARFFPDHRDSVLAQGAEYLWAKAAGLVTEDHVLAEIGAVFADKAPGRQSSGDVTIYKSLGLIVQDLASAAYLYRRRSASSSQDSGERR
ncbi:ornithine cyclodeaminase family protein [Starkeya sp. ORNL1]|uniref:ornithine cyclodeaminase family protein n=1 Tax=Starkeya sp. ORNL1 TaxID=2709380 RepID=UPI0014646943|nr:ornithine cyclodeaminase family protein [Starkeya sp. ORNL1]QJP17324.1 ornithine cyclodeaminase family protein [Starkeya sp. ORNL1]